MTVIDTQLKCKCAWSFRLSLCEACCTIRAARAGPGEVRALSRRSKGIVSGFNPDPPLYPSTDNTPRARSRPNIVENLCSNIE